MKHTDLDFIREKFAGSGVNAPETLDEKFVAEKLSEVEPLKVKKSRKKLIGGLSAAAAAAVVTAASFAVTSIIGTVPQLKPETALFSDSSASLKTFSDRREVKKELKKVIDFNRRFGAYRGNVTEMEEYAAGEAADVGADSVKSYNSSDSASYHNATYLQHTGVDEADTVKTDGKYIYYIAKSDTIEVFSADKENSKRVAVIESGQEADNCYSYFDNFYLYDSKLIALSDVCIEQSVDEEFSDEDRYYPAYSTIETTEVSIYDISDINHIRLTDRFSQSGYYCSSRMIDGMLYVISTQTAQDEDDLPFVYKDGATTDEACADELPADCIYSVENPAQNNFLVVSSIDTNASAQAAKTKAILGSANDVYCNQNFLYVTAREYDDAFYNGLVNNVVDYIESEFFGRYRRTSDSTQIVKVSLEKDIDFIAAARVDGRIDNQYSLDEYNGNLRVATTSANDDGEDINNLYVLDQNLNQIGGVTGFAQNESIQAVRYVDDTAYVITYEQTDPLFVIDVSNPTAPQITGTVKISGFSTMLVPIDDNTLLGIGYHTQDEPDDDIDMEIQEGLKIVTFDVSDKSNPKVLDTKVFVDYSSEVQYNPKALIVNRERGDFTIPVSYYHADAYSLDRHSGILNFRVNNGKIEIVDEYVSKKFSSNSQYGYDWVYGYFWVDCEVERCVYVGDYIYMLGSAFKSGTTMIDCVQYQ